MGCVRGSFYTGLPEQSLTLHFPHLLKPFSPSFHETTDKQAYIAIDCCAVRGDLILSQHSTKSRRAKLRVRNKTVCRVLHLCALPVHSFIACIADSSPVERWADGRESVEAPTEASGHQPTSGSLGWETASHCVPLLLRLCQPFPPKTVAGNPNLFQDHPTSNHHRFVSVLRWGHECRGKGT